MRSGTYSQLRQETSAIIIVIEVAGAQGTDETRRIPAQTIGRAQARRELTSASDVQRNLVVDHPAAGGSCASMTEAVVRCDGRRTRSDKFRHHEATTDRFGRQNTATAHSSGRSRVQLANLSNIAAHVVIRIVLVPLSRQASGEFQATRFRTRGKSS